MCFWKIRERGNEVLKITKIFMIGILRSAFILIAAIAIIGGGTYSYFSTTDSASGTLATGEFGIHLRNQILTDPFTFSVTNILPNGTALVNFDVQNNSNWRSVERGCFWWNGWKCLCSRQYSYEGSKD